MPVMYDISRLYIDVKLRIYFKDKSNVCMYVFKSDHNTGH